jgi:YidC/Oxa1 family membrane protein insertase
MDKDTLLRFAAAIAVSMLIVQVWSYLFVPKQGAVPTPPPQLATQTNEATGSAATPAPQLPSIQVPAAATPEVATTVIGEPNQPSFELSTSAWKLSFSALGGRIQNWELKDYPRSPGKKANDFVDLVSPESRKLDRFAATIYTGEASLDQVLNHTWCVVDRRPPSPDELTTRSLPPGTQRVSFHFAEKAVELTKVFWIPDDRDHLMQVEWQVKRAGEPVSSAALSLGPGIVRPPPQNTTGYVRGAIDYWIAGEHNSVSPLSADGDLSFAGGSGLKWIALHDQYFALVAFPRSEASTRVKFFDTPESGSGHERQAALEVGGGQVTLFAGPKEEQLITTIAAHTGTDLGRLTAWGFFGAVAKPLYVLVAAIRSALGNWGLAIIVVTILIRAVFFYPTQKAMVSMRKNQAKIARLQPKLKKLKEKYEGKRDMESRQKQNREMMAIYQSEGINPLSTLAGCWPMLLQLPVLYAMYTVLTVPIELRGAPFFGWVQDLSIPEPAPWLLLIGMIVTMFVQQLLAMTKTEDPQMKMQQRMMLVMPLMFAFFFWSMPAGLVLYWFTNNLLGIGQQYLINRQADALPAAA